MNNLDQIHRFVIWSECDWSQGLVNWILHRIWLDLDVCQIYKIHWISIWIQFTLTMCSMLSTERRQTCHTMVCRWRTRSTSSLVLRATPVLMSRMWNSGTLTHTYSRNINTATFTQTTNLTAANKVCGILRSRPTESASSIIKATWSRPQSRRQTSKHTRPKGKCKTSLNDTQIYSINKKPSC